MHGNKNPISEMSLSEFCRERLCLCYLDQPIESIAGILKMFCFCIQSGLCFVSVVNTGSWFCFSVLWCPGFSGCSTAPWLEPLWASGHRSGLFLCCAQSVQLASLFVCPGCCVFPYPFYLPNSGLPLSRVCLAPSHSDTLQVSFMSCGGAGEEF